MSVDPATLDLIVRLGGQAGRPEAARALARHAGADDLVMLVADPELGVLLPAPGFAQTLIGGAAWRAFLARCCAPGCHTGEVDLPPGSLRAAQAHVGVGIAAVFIGGVPAQQIAGVVERMLPLLSGLFTAEQRMLNAAAETAEARDGVARAQALANALEDSRAESVKLNAELHDEQRRKDDFLAMLGHELRNPLAPLVTAVELLRRKSGGADANPLIGVMSRQISQLSSLVEDLLDVSRVSRGLIELRRESVCLIEALETAVETVRPLLLSRRHDLQLDLGDGPLPVFADRVRLTQIFANLLHNAAKYTDPGGRLQVRAWREGDQVVVRLADNGIGIAPEMLPRIFDLFAQAPVALDRAQGGLGIGLTLVRTLVGLHGGRVEAASEGRGRGSTFTVRLPVAQDSRLARPRGPAPEAPARRLRILVVDDNEDAADSLAEILRATGHHAEVAYGGLSAVQRVTDQRPDLVLLDIGLPQIDGYEVARRLRHLGTGGVRLVALTGYGTDEDRRRAVQAGFAEHVSKPVTLETLHAIVTRTIEHQGARVSIPAAPDPG